MVQFAQKPENNVKVPKSPKNNIKDTKNTKYRFDSYVDIFTLRTTPVSDTWIEKLALELVDWAINDPEAFKLTQFYRLKGIGSDDMKRWKERNSKLKRAHTIALEALGDKREIGALKKLYEPGTAARTMPRYDPEWRDLEEWRASLKNKDEDKNREPQVIVIDRFPDSDKVPVKITADTLRSDLEKEKEE